MTTPAPALNGLVIGQAERATRAVLDRHLATEGRDFHEWVVLNLLHAAGGADAEDVLVGTASTRLRVTTAAVVAAVDALVTAGQLARDDARLRLTPAGAATRARIQAAIDAIATRFYGDLPAADLATAGRVLTIVTARAEAELAATA
jgi:DNA-binding MarR family transcriptional regulator